MLSSWTLWDFFKNHKKLVGDMSKGLITFLVPESFTAKNIQDYLKHEKSLKVLNASQIDENWIFDNLLSLGFFDFEQAYLFNSAEKFNKASIEAWLSDNSVFNEKLIVFIFNREVPWLKKLQQVEGKHFVLEAPKFWEYDKYLDHLCDTYRVHLSFDARQYFLTTINNEASDFHVALNILALNYAYDKELTVQDLQAVLAHSRLDQFNLANLFAKKEKKQFWEKLLIAQADYDQLRTFFAFLQGHLIKMADPKHLEKKARLTKYDKDIIALAKLWTTDELLKAVNDFSHLETLSKSKSDFLLQTMRARHIEAAKPS